MSGQIGLDPSTMEMPEGVEEQARQALANVGQLLRVSRGREQGQGAGSMEQGQRARSRGREQGQGAGAGSKEQGQGARSKGMEQEQGQKVKTETNFYQHTIYIKLKSIHLNKNVVS